MYRKVWYGVMATSGNCCCCMLLPYVLATCIRRLCCQASTRWLLTTDVVDYTRSTCQSLAWHAHAFINRDLIVRHPSPCCAPCVCRRVHSFGSIDSQGAPILCVEPAPALDVAAVGLADGRVQVRNILVQSCVECTVVC